MTLPPLPEPVNAHNVGQVLRDPAARAYAYIQPPIYTAEQMHAYARAAVEAEREAIIAEIRSLPFGFAETIGPVMCIELIRARGAKGQGNG